MMKRKIYDLNDWINEGERRYGTFENSRWKCPKCGHIATTKDWQESGANINAAGYICLGFFKGVNKPFSGGPCQYNPTIFQNENPVKVLIENGIYVCMFNFADEPLRVIEE